MRKILSMIIYIFGLVSLFFIAYVLTFYFIRNSVVIPYEMDNSPDRHKVRPLYNIIYYPMRKFVANGSSFSPEKRDVYYGTLEAPWFEREYEKGHRTAAIETVDNSSLSIGFTGKKSKLKQFDEVEYGSYVKMVFGVALTEEHDRFINRLIDFEVINLIADPRVPNKEFTKEESQMILNQFNQMNGSAKTCASNYLDDYRAKVLEHCLQAGYAENIGGGCYHVVGYSVNTTVMKEAIDQCGFERAE